MATLPSVPPQILTLLLNVLSELGQEFSDLKYICPILSELFLFELQTFLQAHSQSALIHCTPLCESLSGLCIYCFFCFFLYIYIYNRWIHLNEFTASTSELALPRPNVSLSTLKASIMNDWNEWSIFQIEFCNRIAGVPVRSQMTSEGQGSGNAITGMGGLLHSCRAWEGRAVWMDPILC